MIDVCPDPSCWKQRWHQGLCLNSSLKLSLYLIPTPGFSFWSQTSFPKRWFLLDWEHGWRVCVQLSRLSIGFPHCCAFHGPDFLNYSTGARRKGREGGEQKGIEWTLQRAWDFPWWRVPKRARIIEIYPAARTKSDFHMSSPKCFFSLPFYFACLTKAANE